MKAREGWRRFRSTNLARNATVDRSLLAEDVARAWFSYLLQHPKYLSGRTLNKLVVDIWTDLGETGGAFSADLPYSGLQCYELVREAWADTVPARVIEKWENRRVTALWIGSDPFAAFTPVCRYVFYNILGIISRIVVGQRGYYVLKPAKDWRELLRAYTTKAIFQHHFRMSWTPYAEYSESISHLLAYQTRRGEEAAYLRLLNRRYADRFVQFTVDESWAMISLLDRLIDSAHGSSSLVTSVDEWELLKRLRDSAGDLQIGSDRGVYTLNTLLDEGSDCLTEGKGSESIP